MGRFALVSLIPVLALGWGLSHEMRRTVEARALESFGSAGQASMQIIATTFLRDGAGPEALAKLDSLSAEIGRSFDLEARFRFVLPSGLVVYATHGPAFGLVPVAGDAGRALQGEVAGRFLDERPDWLESTARPFVTWVPVRSDGKTIGALEIVGASEQVAAGLATDLRRLLVGLAIGLAALWLALLPIAASVARRLARQSDENRRLALRDPLTGLANRNLLRDEVERGLHARGGAAVGLLLIDLDDFKEVNDTLGHSHGDLLLEHVARTLLQTTRPTDTVSRLGGDEFAIVVHGPSDASELERLADRILDLLRRPVPINGIEVSVDASVGLALAPDDGTTAELLLQRADIAMYAAKSTKTGHRRYDADLDLHSHSRLALAAQLKRALEKGDEIELDFQPIVSLRTGEIHTVEALARWRHPTRGLLPPSEFLPLAERSGLVPRLTTIVMTRAVEQQRAWLDRGICVGMSVNLAEADLRDPTLADRMRRLLARYDVPTSSLQVELTENGVVGDPDVAMLLVSRLHAHGIRVALDDFGAGSSSLTYLRTLNADVLKVDRSFVANIVDAPTDGRIVSALIEMAHAIGMEVTAEGVETAEQRRVLGAMGCDSMQGLHVSAPLSADAITPLLRAARTLDAA